MIVYGGDREEQRHVRTPGLPDWAGSPNLATLEDAFLRALHVENFVHKLIDDITFNGRFSDFR